MLPPAVVLGGNTNGLGVVRSLAAVGPPVFVVDVASAASPAMLSRYGRPIIARAIEGDGLIEELIRLSRRFDQPAVLFPTTDDQVLTISRHRDRLSEAFRIRLPVHSTVCDLMDKERFQELAHRLGYEVPRSIILRRGDKLATLETLRVPLIIKPGQQLDFSSGRLPRNHLAQSRAEVNAYCARVLSTVRTVVVQEWIPGDDSDIYFCLQYRGGEARAVSFTGRKLHSWPPRTGSTASCMPAYDLDAEAERLTSQLFDRCGVVGVASMEFKRDRSSGGLMMIEPTIGRTDLQEEVAALNGVNIAGAAYAGESGVASTAAIAPRRPIIWRDSRSYWLSVLWGRAPSDRRLAGREVEVKGTFWRPDDPTPSLPYLSSWIHQATVRAAKSALRRVRRSRPARGLD